MVLKNVAGLCLATSWRWVHYQICNGTSASVQFFMCCVFVKYWFQNELRQFFLQGLKSVDSSVKKESDLPAADPSTPIPLKYEDESTSGGPECLEKQMALFLDKSKLYCCANKTFPVPAQTAVTSFWLTKCCTCVLLIMLLYKQEKTQSIKTKLETMVYSSLNMNSVFGIFCVSEHLLLVNT